MSEISSALYRHLVLLLLACPLLAPAQIGYVPLSREVERQYALKLYSHKTDFHTSIRPYRLREVREAMGTDTVAPSALPILDRWAGVPNGRKFRWGPLVDASVGLQPGADAPLIHRGGAGFWADADLGDRLNFHVDARLWNQRFPNYLDSYVRATQITPGEGYAYGDAPNYTHYDVNGHVSWDVGRFFNFTAGRGRNFFGEGYRSLMLSNEAQGYPYLKITTTVWRIKYVNLFALMNDIRGAGGDPRLFQRKYAAMHYLSWNAHPRLNVSLFETVIMGQGTDEYPRGFDIHYLNPIIFYRPVEFHVGSPDNVLLGISVNGKVGRNTMLYSQFVLDEFIMYHIRNGTGWYGNKQSLQFGAVARNAFKIPGLTLRAEWNYIRPFMYTHVNNIQNHAHFGQPLAHPYGSNVHELIGHADLEQGRWLYSLRTSMAWMGADSVDSYGNNIFRADNERPRLSNNRPVDLGYYHGHHRQVMLLHAEVRGGYLLDRNTGTRLEASYLFRYRSIEGGAHRPGNIIRLGITCYFMDRYREQDVRYFLE